MHTHTHTHLCAPSPPHPPIPTRDSLLRIPYVTWPTGGSTLLFFLRQSSNPKRRQVRPTKQNKMIHLLSNLLSSVSRHLHPSPLPPPSRHKPLLMSCLFSFICKCCPVASLPLQTKPVFQPRCAARCRTETRQKMSHHNNHNSPPPPTQPTPKENKETTNKCSPVPLHRLSPLHVGTQYVACFV